jgi:hypothetical protein
MTDNLKYDFALIGEKMAEVLLKAADETMFEAEHLKERTKILADSINMQLKEHSIRLTDINRRVEALRNSVQDAHEKFIDDK